LITKKHTDYERRIHPEESFCFFFLGSEEMLLSEIPKDTLCIQ